MKELVFLPDREGRDEIRPGAGFVRVGTDAAALGELSGRLTVPAASSIRADEAAWRGTMAFALLADVWADVKTRIRMQQVDPSTSPFASWVLASEKQKTVFLILAEENGQRCLLGVADREWGIRLPGTPGDLAPFMPRRVQWYDHERHVMGDPLPFLPETDRMIVSKRLRLMNFKSPQIKAFMDDLAAVGAQEVSAVREGDENALARLTLRMQAIHGLRETGALTVYESPYRDQAKNAFVGLFSTSDVTAEDLAWKSRTYLWEGIPFACSDSRIGLRDVIDSRQEDALFSMAPEVELLSDQSAAWARRTETRLSGWLDRRRLTMIPAARALGEELRQKLHEAGMQVQSAVTLTWPWDASCGAVRMLLGEALGEGWMAAAAAPFADRLTKMTGATLGDVALQTCCACADGVLLPPLSPAMAACVAAAKDGEGLALDAMRFEPRMDGGITASFLLRGTGEVLMQRTYPVEEMTVLSAADVPAVAVWPCVPLDRWHAYHVFARGGSVRVEAMRGEKWKRVPDALPDWNCLRTSTYPACLTVMQDEWCLGALPNHLPECQVEPLYPAVGAIDLGTCTTTAALMLDGKAEPLKGQDLTRLLIRPQDMGDDPFLNSLTPTASVPTAVELTGPDTKLFTDGHILAISDTEQLAALPAASLRTSLKWRADATSLRAKRLLLLQVMQGVSLTAMLSGAASIRWQVTVPDEIDDTGRQAGLDMVKDLAGRVAERTGLHLTQDEPVVLYAEESAAQCAWLRAEGGVKGSFAALDLGGGSIKLHLWLQGQRKPVAGAVLMDGVNTLLLDALHTRPEMLAYDFADHPDEALQFSMQDLEGQLAQAGTSRAEKDKALVMLDTILREYREPLTRHLYERAAAQNPTFMQSVLLEDLTAAMFTAGLMLEQAGSDIMINHKLPDDMPICLTGRGAWLLDSLTPGQRNALQVVPRKVMRLDNPVRFITLKSVAQPMMATALGMAMTRDTGAALSVPEIRTRASFSQMMHDLVLQFIAHYPTHAWVLHEAFFDQWGTLSPHGEETIRTEAARCYGDGEDIPGAVMTFVRRLRQASAPGGMYGTNA